jgi:DNA gyrase subunit A
MQEEIITITKESKIKIDHRPDLFKSTVFLVFTSGYNVYKVENDYYSKTSQILSKVDFDLVEEPIYLTGTKFYRGFLIVGFEDGKVGKISMKAFMTDTKRKKLKNALNAESKLIFLEHFENDVDLVAYSSIKKVIVFNTRLINPVDSKITKGIQVIKEKEGSFLSKIKPLSQVNFVDPEYYRKNDSLNAVGFFLKKGDEF